MALDYVTENPFLDRLNQRRGEFTDQSIRDAQLSYEQQKLKEHISQEDLRRRELEAGVRSSESGMRVAEGTEGFDINRSGFEARRSGTLADQADQDLSTSRQRDPYSVRESQAEAERAEFELGEDRATAPDERRRVRAQAGQAEANLSRLKDQRYLQNFNASIEALRSGNVALAQHYARLNGEEIPPEIIQNEQMIQATIEFADQAKTFYGNRPRLMMEFMRSAYENLGKQGGYTPGMALTAPNIPAPPERASHPLSSTAGGGAAGSSGISADDRRILQSVESANSRYGEIDAVAVGDHLVRIGRPDLAQLYDPSVQVPSQDTTGPQAAAPQPGTVEEGYEFLGGDASDPQNWRPVR